MMYPLMLVCGAVLLFVYIREKIQAYSVKAVILKSSVSVLFIAVGVYGSWLSAAKGTGSLLCPFVVLGLLCGLLGDIWLDLKYVFPEKDEPFTYAGFCAFGIGHILYISGMLLSYYPSGRPVAVIVPVLLAVLMSVGNAVLEKPMKLSYGRMRSVVLIYGFCLFSTVFVSGLLWLEHREPTLCFVFIGSILFAISDLILSGTFFGSGKDRPIDIISNYLFYYSGQFLIAYSLVLLK